MQHRSLRGAIAGAALIATMTIPLAACGGKDDKTEANYCAAWQDVATAFKQVGQIDVVQGGLDSVKESVAALKTSLDGLKTAAKDQLGAEVANVGDAAQKLADTVTSPDLPVDRRTEVRAAKDNLTTAWDALVSKAKADCPSVDVGS